MPTKANLQTTVTLAMTKSTFKIGEPCFINFKVQNNTETDFEFCYWQTPLEKEFTSNFFEIECKGRIISYEGKMVKRSPATANDTIRIKSKEAISQKIEFTKAYHLDQPGTYTIKYLGSTINGLPNSNTLEFALEK